jgi:heme/copper-type cytochrome/quinol oxidase subunit 3
VLGGIALLAIVLGLNTQRTAVETVAMYWHFVDGVWLIIFAVVYLWTFL